jgi:excisionase family DNA binding protein
MTDQTSSTAPPGGSHVADVVDIRTGGIVLAPARVTYTVPEIAALLGISRATAYALLRTGDIPARRIGSRWIIACRRFDLWLQGDLDGASR